MSKYWLTVNAQRFSTDILRDFCQISTIFEEQATRFETAGNVSFAVLRDLTGDVMNKGQLWHMKDMAHHILRDTKNPTPAGKILDWIIGYIFHESLKLLEEAHQHQYYAPSLSALAEDNAFAATPEEAAALFNVVAETKDDMRRGIQRIQNIIKHALTFLPPLYTGQASNRYLARFLYDQETMVRNVFKKEYVAFIAAIYADSPERLYIEAACSLLEAGQYTGAITAVQQAAAMAPDKNAIKEEIRHIERAAKSGLRS